MADEQRYKRDQNGIRFQMGGINTVLSPDILPPTKYPYAQNVRAYLQGRTTGRATQSDPQITLGAAVHSLRRLNDTTPNGPVSGFALIGGAGTDLYLNATAVASGLSGNPFSLVPFRPSSSPQPWMYIADSAPFSDVNIIASSFPTNGMLKVRSDGLTYKMGVKEPQDSPLVATASSTVSGSDTVLGTARPFSNVAGQNPTFNYSDTGNGTGPSIILTPTVGSQLEINTSGTAVINGVSHAPGDAGGVGPTNPGQFAVGGTCAVLMGAWTDSSGNVITNGVVSVGLGVTLVVPAGASQFQLGIDGIGGNFSGNTGSFTANWSVITSALSTNPSTIGMVQAYVWGTPPPAGGGSPHSGPVANYLWKNPSDGGTGTPRSITSPVPDASPTNNSWQLDSSPEDGTVPMLWDMLDSTGAVVGQIPLFQPQLESAGYQDFNACFVGNIFIPSGGTYTFTLENKDQILFGIGGNATVPGGPVTSPLYAQTKTVVSGLPLLLVTTPNGSGGTVTTNLAVTFPAAGVYPVEIDYDYWFHSGRKLVMLINGGVIPPITAIAKENVTYRYTYRSSITGATSNPSPESPVSNVPSISNTITPEFSDDPQVDKIDYYRMDTGLDNFTYVGTGPNTNPPTPFTDTLLDADVVGNPLLQFDNFEPFPSIDLPKGGIVDVIGGVVTWSSGDPFNDRWLPGTIINIGGPAYTLFSRPLDPHHLLAIDVPDGTGLIYEIAEPILAAQPMPSMWGDTDNTIFAFAVGDKLRPGTLYWCKGNNLDSAPDTNQQDVTSPSEPLINGVIENGIGFVMSAENGWLIYPNFYQALATITGTEGSAFSLIRSEVTRGLYIRPCICTDGSGIFFYRSKDGIEKVVGAGTQKSITDDDLYNLFTHEGSVPEIVSIGTFEIVPPDDTSPELQHLAFATGYLYYDYQGIDSQRHTLVLDVGGWVADVYQHPATIHVLEEGPNINGVLVGCSDGTVRVLESGGTEVATCIVVTPVTNMGDARANKTLGDIFVRASIRTNALTVTAVTNYFNTVILGTIPATLPATFSGVPPVPAIIDFPNGIGANLSDIAVVFSWLAGNDTFLDLWQPDWTELPENSKNRPTDWTDAGMESDGFWQGLTLEADTLGQPKRISVQSGDDLSFHTPDQSPVTFNGQSKQTLTFTPPFIAHTVRIVTIDGVPWRYWGAKWVVLPFPSSVIEWQTQFSALGGKGWQHIREVNIAYISTQTMTLTLTFDPGASPTMLSIPVPSSNGLQAKLKIPVPRNKFKLVAFQLSGVSPFRIFAEDMEIKIGEWGRESAYRNIGPIGGPSAPGARV